MADDFYHEGNKYFKAKEYEKAIEYYTWSIESDQVADSYYNRAQCYFKLLDSCNFCRDLFMAFNLGDKESEKIYYARCAVVDTIRATADSIFKEFPGYSYTIFTRSICNEDSARSYRDSVGIKIQSAFESMPEFPGGENIRNRFLAENLIYPMEARENGIQGVVNLSFFVENDGTMSEITVLKGPGSGINEEAMRVVQMMPKWKPGKIKGKPARVKFYMSVHFTLRG